MGKYYINSSNASIAVNSGFTLILFFLITFFNPLSAQQKVIAVQKFISQAEQVEIATELETLAFGVQPTVYVNEGTFVPKGNAPTTVAYISASDIMKIQEGHESLGSVKLLIVKFKDQQELMAFKLRPADVSNLPLLAYVFFSLEFESTPTEVPGVQGFEQSEIVFLYESARPF
ncbi:hypothetical protein [Anditalea andensis]|uniref:Uncharacterized protein n=1 Tax=Anditalea andensis TaxID=1048983 RepID=A0A074KWB9_9BACT|nr:hypothetical protein [Anditalea andensis]KEO73214.1 hypothetical protein EL17_12735 [Anditalea andensis]